MNRFVFLSILMLLGFSASASASPLESINNTLPTSNPPVISWDEADDYVNQFVIVQGTIVLTHYAAGSNGQPTFLNFHDPYEDYLTCIIWGDDRPEFPPNPEDYYLYKLVRVRGSIKNYEGSPEIILYGPSQIQIVNPDGSWPGFE